MKYLAIFLLFVSTSAAADVRWYYYQDNASQSASQMCNIAIGIRNAEPQNASNQCTFSDADGPEGEKCYGSCNGGPRTLISIIGVQYCAVGEIFDPVSGYCIDEPQACEYPFNVEVDGNCQCSVGSLHPSCQVACPANEHHTGGYVGFGEQCPHDYSASDYGCITNGDWHDCLPPGEGPQNKLPEYSGAEPIDGTGASDEGEPQVDGNGNPVGSSGGSGGVTQGGDGNGGVQAGYTPGGGCIIDVLESGIVAETCDVPEYESWSGLENDCAGGCTEQDFENTNLRDACRLNPTMDACSQFDPYKIYDICGHGGVADAVIGCDYVPDWNCGGNSVPTSYGGCTVPPSQTVTAPRPDWVPPPEVEPPTYDRQTTTSTRTEVTTSETQGDGSVITRTVTTETSEGSKGECDPESKNYAECAGFVQTGTADYSLPAPGNTISESATGYYNGIASAPIVVAASNISTMFTGSGSCPAPTFEVFGQVFALDYHCTLYTSIASIISAFMIALWTIVGIRTVFSA